MTDLELTSPAFEDGARIPNEYGYQKRNVNPPLRIENVPDETSTLALVMDDPDAVEPAGKVWDHWIVWNIPPSRREIPQDWTPSEASEGRNDYGETGYDGPNPPDREHRYRFKLFALDTSLDLPSDTDAERLEDAVDGYVLAETQLDGTYPA
jgi:Raf kinase inhibitor-like YbhB/YbcL family protein